MLDVNQIYYFQLNNVRDNVSHLISFALTDPMYMIAELGGVYKKR